MEPDQICSTDWEQPPPEEEHSLYWIGGGAEGKRRRQQLPYGVLPLDIELQLKFALSDSSEESSDDDDDVEEEKEEQEMERDLSSSGERGPAPPEEERREGEGGSGRRGKMVTRQPSALETETELVWERRRRRQIQLEEERKNGRPHIVTDVDLDELRGCIELGFGFDEERGGRQFCETLPALDFYFAVKRQLSNCSMRSVPSPNTPATKSSTDKSTSSPSIEEITSSFGSIMSESESLKRFGPPGS